MQEDALLTAITLPFSPLWKPWDYASRLCLLGLSLCCREAFSQWKGCVSRGLAYLSLYIVIFVCVFASMVQFLKWLQPPHPLLKDSLDKLHMIYPYYRWYRHAWVQMRFARLVSQVPFTCTFKVEAYWQSARLLTHLPFAIHMLYLTVWCFSSCRFVTYHPSKLAWLNYISWFAPDMLCIYEQAKPELARALIKRPV